MLSELNSLNLKFPFQVHRFPRPGITHNQESRNRVENFESNPYQIETWLQLDKTLTDLFHR